MGKMVRVLEVVAEDGLIRLPEGVPSSAHCVVTILDGDDASLREQSELTIPEEKQQRMSELLLKNREGTLAEAEQAELDALAEEFERATLTKGRALAALAQRSGSPQNGG